MAACDDDCAPGDLTHACPAYRRSLALVVALNLSMGLGEMIAGFLAASQSLKADALDFLGDGLITLLGLVAIGWSQTWRARAAFLQGVFLALLGVGVLGAAGYRVFVAKVPEAQVMGIVGAIALVINVISALLLLRHRHGDAGVRAVWLFSRNDAIGNVAVIVAGVLVGWTASGWPDLIAAVFIAGLFLHSAVRILLGARAELREVETAPALAVPSGPAESPRS